MPNHIIREQESKDIKNISTWRAKTINPDSLEQFDHAQAGAEKMDETERVQRVFTKADIQTNANFRNKVKVISYSEIEDLVKVWKPEIVSQLCIDSAETGESNSFIFNQHAAGKKFLGERSGEAYADMRLEADEIKQEAEMVAAEILKNAESKAQQITEESYQSGLAAADEKAREILNSAAKVFEETQKMREVTLKRSEESVISLLQTIAAKLFGKGFALDAQTVEQMVVRAVSEASRLGNVRVYMNPVDEERLVELWQDSEIKVNGQKIQLVPSENIDQGGCFVEGEFGSVDGRIGTQLEAIQSQINQMLVNQEDLIP